MLVLVLGSTLVGPSPSLLKVRGEASTPPALKIRDTWKYAYNNNVTSIASVIGISIPCATGVNDVCTVNVEESSSQANYQWLLPDWSLVKDNLTRSGASQNDTFSPPAPIYSWPLTVGKTWTISSAIQTTVVTADGVQTNSTVWNQTRKVSAEETITVPAGTFDTFVIDGFDSVSQRQVLRRWYSYQAKTSVRAEFFNPSNGAITSSFELVSCAVSGFTCRTLSSNSGSTGLSSSVYEALGAAFAVGIAGVGGLLFFRSRSRQKKGLVRPLKRK